MYTPVKLQLTESQIDKLRYGKQNKIPTTLQIEKSQVGTGEHNLYLTNRQINKLKRMNSKSVRLSLSKTQMIAQKGGFLKFILPLAKKLLPTVGKVLGTLGLAGASGAVSAAAHKAVNKRGSGLYRAGKGMNLYVPKKEIETMVKTTNELENHNILPKGTTTLIMSNIKEQKGGFIGTLLATLAGSILPSLLGGKGKKKKNKF